MAKKNRQKAVRRWEAYYNEDCLEHWQNMVAALDIDGHYASKTQCRKVLSTCCLLDS